MEFCRWINNNHRIASHIQMKQYLPTTVSITFIICMSDENTQAAVECIFGIEKVLVVIPSNKKGRQA